MPFQTCMNLFFLWEITTNCAGWFFFSMLQQFTFMHLTETTDKNGNWLFLRLFILFTHPSYQSKYGWLNLSTPMDHKIRNYGDSFIVLVTCNNQHYINYSIIIYSTIIIVLFHMQLQTSKRFKLQKACKSTIKAIIKWSIPSEATLLHVRKKTDQHNSTFIFHKKR